MTFEKVDLFFGKSFTEDEETILFLARIFKDAREGHLCTIINEPKKIPSEIMEEVLVQEGNRWYLKRNYECEQILIKNLERLKNSDTEKIPFSPLDCLNEDQNLSVAKALNSPLTFICGGPGTGKTRTAASIISHFTTKKVAVCAPTGKATANLRQLIQENENWTFATLQGLLKKKRQTYLPYDLIVVDEGSMVDAFLMTELFLSIYDGTKLVILGDVNQLPPVGVGNFFSDLVRREKNCAIFLKKCLRAELEEILNLANQVNNRQVFPIISLPTQKELISSLVKTLKLDKKLPLENLFLQYQQHRVLTPQRKGPFGVETLNGHLYEWHKRNGGEYIPIIIKINDPDSEIYNGDFGFISERESMAYFINGKKIPLSLLPAFEYGYLLSVHKSQGSEYDEVMVLLPEGAENFGKEMLYTAVTRAKKKVTIFGDCQILEKIYKNDGKRISGL